MIDITRISALIDALRNETQKEAITPEALGALLQFMAELVAACASEADFLPVRTGLGEMKSAYGELNTQLESVGTSVNRLNSHCRALDDQVAVVREIAELASAKADYAEVTDIAVVCGQHHVETRLKQKGFTRVVADLPAATATAAGVMTVEQVAKLAAAITDISTLKKAKAEAGRGFIYVDIESSDYLRVLGCEAYLSADFVPILFRYSRKANRYYPKDVQLGHAVHEHTRKGWHPMGMAGCARVDAESKIVWLNQSVFDPDDHSESCQPQDFVTRNSRGECVYYGKSKVSLNCKDGSKYRRVRLLYGIAFIHRDSIEAGKRLDLSRLVTNICPFHLQWDWDNGESGYKWIFSK